jgi:apolipoprotein N-acyltransferase
VSRYLLAFLSGAILGAPFLVPVAWPLVFVGLVPLLVSLENGSLARRSSFTLGVIAGLALYGEALWAIFWTVLPLNWLGVFTPAFQIIIVSVSWSLTSLGLAVWTGFFAVTYNKLRQRTWLDVLLVASLWVLAEYAGAWWFGIQNLGPGSILGPNFTLPFIGNVLAHDVALVQLAWLGGVYALSFLCALVSALIYAAWSFPNMRKYAFIGLVALVLVWGVTGIGMRHIASSPQGPHVSVAAVSTQRPAVFTLTQEEGTAQASTTLAELPATKGADIVIVPEGTDLIQTLNMIAPSRGEKLLRALYADAAPSFVDSGNAYSSVATLRSRITLYDVASGSYQYQDKRFLLPDGEYVPWYVQAWVGLVGQSTALSEVSGRNGLTPAPEIRPLVVASTTIGVLFCDETMSPDLYRSLALQGASVFVNVASHAWFHGSHLVADQMRDTAIVRAVESRRWYVQASNIAPSFVLDPYGRVATSSVWGASSVIRTDVGLSNGTTPYMRFGAWMVWLSILMLLIISVRRVQGVQ